MSNPVFSEKVFDQERILDGECMTINGTINKTFILLAFLSATSLYVWNLFLQGFTDRVATLEIVGLVSSLIIFMIIRFNPKIISIMAPIFALAEGLFIGGFSVRVETIYPGVAIQAVGGTIVTLFVMLALYRVGAIRCSEKFRSVIFISTLSIAGIYIVNLVGSFFGLQIPQIFTPSLIGIGFSVLVIVIAALNLILDFDFIERGTQNSIDKNFEWYGAFALLVTLVWLYIEILNLLAKLRSR